MIRTKVLVLTSSKKMSVYRSFVFKNTTFLFLLKFLVFPMCSSVAVVVQFYPWFNFYFLLFLYGQWMIMSIKQRKIKIEPRIKLNHNIAKGVSLMVWRGSAFFWRDWHIPAGILTCYRDLQDQCPCFVRSATQCLTSNLEGMATEFYSRITLSLIPSPWKRTFMVLQLKEPLCKTVLVL